MPASKTSKFALSFIFITVLIDVIGIGIIFPVMPDLLLELTGESVTSALGSDGLGSNDLGKAAIYGGLMAFLYSTMLFLFSPILGNLSDRFGRRPIILISLVGLGIDYLILGFASSLLWLFIARILSGIAGASFSTANAYIADVSKPSERAKNFGLIGAAFGLGFIIGPLIGGVLGEYGSRVPFFAAAGFSFANAIYGFFILPETLDAKNRRPFDIKRANPLGALMQLRKYPLLIGLVAALFFLNLGGHIYETVWSFFVKLLFTWSPAQIGYSLGAYGIAVVVVQAFLLRYTINKFGESRTIAIGLAFGFFAFIGFVFVTTPLQLYLLIFPSALAGLVQPALTGIMANQVPDNEQGELQGTLSAVASLTSMLTPIGATQIFAYFTREGATLYLPGAPFLMGAALTLISIIIIWTQFARKPATSYVPPTNIGE